MEATIIVSERKEKAGTGKNGKPYLLTTLVSRDEGKYTGFNIDKEIQPGYSVKLYAKENQGYKNSYNIERIIEYDANPTIGKTAENQGKAGGKPQSTPLSNPEKGILQPKPTEEMRHEWILTAIRIMGKAGMDTEIESNLLTELVRQQHSEWMSEKIAAEQRARWGK